MTDNKTKAVLLLWNSTCESLLFFSALKKVTNGFIGRKNSILAAYIITQIKPTLLETVGLKTNTVGSIPNYV